MKAMLVKEGRLVLSEVADPSPKADEILIGICAAALNRADLLQKKGTYPSPKGWPQWPGLECAGRVLALVRLVLIPGIVLGMCMLLRLVTGLNGPEHLLIPVIIAAMPVGMNIVIFREEDGEESAQVVFLSLLFSVATVPLLFMLLAYLG